MTDQQGITCPWPGWNLVKLLGSGTYGKVYLFKREEYGHAYYSAIKHITIPTDHNQVDALFAEGIATNEDTLKDYCTELLESFMGELSINAFLRGHKNFVFCDDYRVIPLEDEPGYNIYIKMEFLTNLSDYLRQKPLTLGDVLHLGEDICNALSVLRIKNLIHQDIKPENIFINKNGDFKLGDFGIVRSLDKSVTRMTACGKLMFMAPELLRHEKTDNRIDIYSLGLILYRLLNGNRAPFLPPHPREVSHIEYNMAQDMRMRGEYLPPPAYADDEISAIILQACAFDVNQRFRDAGQMKEKLLEYRNSLGSRAKQAVILDISGKNTPSSTILPENAAKIRPIEIIRETTLKLTRVSPISILDPGLKIQDTASLRTAKTGKKKRLHHAKAGYLLMKYIRKILKLYPKAIIRKSAHALFLFRQKVSRHWRQFSLIAATLVVMLAMLGILLMNSPQSLLQDENDPSQAAHAIEPLAMENLTVPAKIDLVNTFEGSSLPKTDFDPETLSDTDSLADPDTFSDTDSLADPDTLSNTDSLANPDILLNTDSLVNPDPLSNTDSLANPDTISDTYTLADQNPLVDTGSLADTNHFNDTDPLSGTNQLTDAKPLSDSNPLLGNNPLLDQDTLTDTNNLSDKDAISDANTSKDTETVFDTTSVTTDAGATPDPPLKPDPKPVMITDISLSHSNKLLEIGESFKLSATISPSDTTETALVWSSSNSSIATVDKLGNVTAISPGTAIITVICGGQNAICHISVN